jgi:hypothetical protein
MGEMMRRFGVKCVLIPTAGAQSDRRPSPKLLGWDPVEQDWTDDC